MKPDIHAYIRPGAHAHLVGIGGVSMSPLAEVLHGAGVTITGSDMHDSETVEHLRSLGIPVVIGHRGESVQGAGCVIRTAAVHDDNPEIAAARAAGIPVFERAEAWGAIMRHYQNALCVAGTHGKTTTTSMCTQIFLAAQRDPTVMIGGTLPALGAGHRVGKGDTIILESCEYCNSFLSFFPTVAVILNVDADHLDFFKDLEDVKHSFRRFAQLIPKDGLLIINGAIPRLSEITDGLSCRVATFGSSPENDYFFTDIAHDDTARASFVLHFHGKELPVRLGVPGEHNIANAAAALALADHLDLDMERAAESLHGFTGTDRRFEYKGELHGVTIIDDYAHHPTEIEATLKAAANYPHRTLWCVFQPHTYSRTKAFFHDFARALSHADHVILADIYAARETDTLGVSSALLCQEIRNLGTDCRYFPSFEEIEKFILENCIPGDLLITMGAGNVVNIGEDLLGQ